MSFSVLEDVFRNQNLIPDQFLYVFNVHVNLKQKIMSLLISIVDPYCQLNKIIDQYSEMNEIIN